MSAGRIWIEQPSAAPSPADIAGYLRQQGWVVQSTELRWARYARAIPQHGDVVVEVPQQVDARDYARVVAGLLDDIARLEARPAAVLLRDVRAASIDIVRLAMEGTLTRDGTVPVEAGRQIYAAARDMLLAAACSALDPRPVYAKKKPDEAMALLRRARFGQTELGSFVLTMECSVPPRLNGTLWPEHDASDPEAPLDRRTTAHLARGLDAALSAARESAARGGIDAFRDATRLGVSANLCEAVADILEAAEAESLDAGFSFAAVRPIGPTVPRRVVFTPDTRLVLREAASQLRATAPSHTELTGFVVKLQSASPSDGGVVVLAAELDRGQRRVSVTLGPDDYASAIRAHADGLEVRCSGDLVKEGKGHSLRSPKDFELIEAPAS